MKNKAIKLSGLTVVLAAVLLFLFAVNAQAISGIENTTFSLTAKQDFISTPDGGSLTIWGYADGNGRAQYPGPTLIVPQGQLITISLANELTESTSMVFPGQTDVSGGFAAPGGTVTYTFTATHPGTFMYHSGTTPEVQVEMGLFGALIVRPYGFDPANPRAYNHADSSYDREYLYLISEMDPRIHQEVAFNGQNALVGTDYLSNYFPVYWFVNGRNAPDSLFPDEVPWLPTQPYGSLAQMHPGDKVLMRVIGGGRQLHPFHHHGNHARIIGRDGRFLESSPGLGADLSFQVFTITSVPGETVDAIFEWTGKNMGWDIYGHAPGDPLEPNEYADDHGQPIPVRLPEAQNMAFGGFWSGSPFLGAGDSLPPGEGGLNPNGAFTYLWHSHTEKELANNDIFPGGLLTIMFIEHPSTPIE
jgi:hypothetical protein